jgi:hypothetical protein
MGILSAEINFSLEVLLGNTFFKIPTLEGYLSKEDISIVRNKGNGKLKGE